ncbi:hypothetical protein KRR39_12400 [Nocardioides panacis]|uniref:GP-PDE domain-containing protein n=1 Tax=Nocardioides panacis TaxID=2849501 RepID=A0A975SV53_9ACTN|nr:glycerophosphodiester phosphodiesterase family protein [Nocardioides panacis]QWZ06403.1 hypothetical protein KRR39_12400 [Nocardioides panacis]
MFRSSTRTVTAAAVAGALLLLAAPAEAADPAPSGVQVIAHRGAVDRAPEHTLAAFDQAVADHADRVGLDVRLTADGVPVVVHDADLARTTDVEQKLPGAGGYPVEAYTLAQVKTLDAGSWYPGGGYTDARVLTLDEVLTELAGSRIGLTLEVKNPAVYGGVGGIGATVKQVLDAHPEWSVGRADGSPRLVVESFDWAFLDGLHATYPDLPLVLLGDTVGAVDLDARPWVREIDARHDTLTSATVQKARGLGIFVGTWTANGTAELQHAVDLGAAGVTTDQPDLLRTLLVGQARTWTGASWPEQPPTVRADALAPSTAQVGGRVQVSARAVTAADTRVPWQTVTFQSRLGGVWRTVGSNATDAHGWALLSLPVNETMRVRVVTGGVVSAERAVTAVTAPVVPPPGAPGPSLHPAAQARPTTAGADPRTSAVSSAVWRAMAGRSWRKGCPVGRSGLRMLQVSYWGFDGHRHRGTLVVARGSAAQLGRVFRRLYAQRLPVRSLRRLETMGGWSTAVGRARRADAGFGFACQRVPGDRTRTGSHARGTMVTLNPWENPATVSHGVPDRWWLSRTRNLPYVHTASNPVVRAFAAEGFAWSGKYGKYADFRDVR